MKTEDSDGRLLRHIRGMALLMCRYTKELKDSDRIVFLFFIGQTDRLGAYIEASYEAIAKSTMLHKRTVIRAVERLKEWGLLIRVNESGMRGTSIHYVNPREPADGFDFLGMPQKKKNIMTDGMTTTCQSITDAVVATSASNPCSMEVSKENSGLGAIIDIKEFDYDNQQHRRELGDFFADMIRSSPGKQKANTQEWNCADPALPTCVLGSSDSPNLEAAKDTCGTQPCSATENGATPGIPAFLGNSKPIHTPVEDDGQSSVGRESQKIEWDKIYTPSDEHHRRYRPFLQAVPSQKDEVKAVWLRLFEDEMCREYVWTAMDSRALNDLWPEVMMMTCAEISSLMWLFLTKDDENSIGTEFKFNTLKENWRELVRGVNEGLTDEIESPAGRERYRGNLRGGLLNTCGHKADGADRRYSIEVMQDRVLGERTAFFPSLPKDSMSWFRSCNAMLAMGAGEVGRR